MIPLTKHRLLFDQDHDSPLGGFRFFFKLEDRKSAGATARSMNVNELKDDANEPFKVCLRDSLGMI